MEERQTTKDTASLLSTLYTLINVQIMLCEAFFPWRFQPDTKYLAFIISFNNSAQSIFENF